MKIMINGGTPLRSNSKNRLMGKDDDELGNYNHSNTVDNASDEIMMEKIHSADSSSLYLAGSDDDIGHPDSMANGDNNGNSNKFSSINNNRTSIVVNNQDLLLRSTELNPIGNDGNFILKRNNSKNKSQTTPNNCAISMSDNNHHHHNSHSNNHHSNHHNSHLHAMFGSTTNTNYSSVSSERKRSLKMIICSYVLTLLVLLIIAGCSFAFGLYIAQCKLKMNNY